MSNSKSKWFWFKRITHRVVESDFPPFHLLHISIFCHELSLFLVFNKSNYKKLCHIIIPAFLLNFITYSLQINMTIYYLHPFPFRLCFSSYVQCPPKSSNLEKIWKTPYTPVSILIGVMAKVANNVPIEVFRVKHLELTLGYMENEIFF